MVYCGFQIGNARALFLTARPREKGTASDDGVPIYSLLAAGVATYE
jgi:hypothetical protein